jgi:hypothetical protein
VFGENDFLVEDDVVDLPTLTPLFSEFRASHITPAEGTTSLIDGIL